MKKILSFIMCIVMVLTIAPLSGIVPLVSAETRTGKINNIQWTLDTETGVLELSGTGGTENYGTGGVESVIHGKDESPFYQNYRLQITTVKIGSGITSLGDYLFYRCSKISSITIPDTVKSIGEGAFGGCNSMDVYITDMSTLFISRSLNNFPTIKNLYLN
ncbi:MAG: leucine-rich repeat protein, partial [Clostridia bacterium]|nr:leucine-rich repeat protein [Clostridia bacterium]